MYIVATDTTRIDYASKRDALATARDLAATNDTVYVWHVHRIGMELIAVYEDGVAVDI